MRVWGLPSARKLSQAGRGFPGPVQAAVCGIPERVAGGSHADRQADRSSNQYPPAPSPDLRFSNGSLPLRHPEGNTDGCSPPPVFLIQWVGTEP